MRAVIILGAGASAPFGVPILRHLFKDVQARRHLRANPDFHRMLQNVFWEPRAKDLESSHETISAEEMLTITRDYERYPERIHPLLDDVEGFRKQLLVLIKKAVYNEKSSRGRFLNPLIDFARARFEHTTWASFNWDCLFESSFYYSSADPFPIAIRGNPQVVIDLHNWTNPVNYPHVFLKLHGGINWWFENGRVVYLPFGGRPDLNDRWRQYEEGTASGQPVLLEPSYYKYEDPIYEILKPQWDVLINDLTVADRVVIVGYSLPEADAMARIALTMGFQSGRPDSRWIVVNRDSVVCDRFNRFFGTLRVSALPISFEDFSLDIRGHLEMGEAA